MADATEENFQDPALKSAVCRCWACDCAPAELRAKVQRLLQDRDAAREARPMILRFPRSTWALAAAAVVVLMLGLSFRHWLPGAQSPNVVAVADLPASLPDDLVDRHDLCCKAQDHQELPVPKSDDKAITAALQKELSRAVLVARPSGPGWDFHGAAICPVGGIDSGHLVFSRGNDTLSIFSLPHDAAPKLKDGDHFVMTDRGHSIVGFEKAGALFCLVANSPGGTFTTDDLQQLQTQVQPDVTIARANAPEPVTVAELLRPSGN